MNQYLRFEVSLNHIQVVDTRAHFIVISVLLEPNGLPFEKGWAMVGEAVKHYINIHA